MSKWNFRDFPFACRVRARAYVRKPSPSLSDINARAVSGHECQRYARRCGTGLGRRMREEGTTTALRLTRPKSLYRYTYTYTHTRRVYDTHGKVTRRHSGRFCGGCARAIRAIPRTHAETTFLDGTLRWEVERERGSVHKGFRRQLKLKF